jgi:heterodisulfide reductase subunit A
VIDREACTYFQKGKCRLCEKICPQGAIAFDQVTPSGKLKVGAVIIATGYD